MEPFRPNRECPSRRRSLTGTDASASPDRRSAAACSCPACQAEASGIEFDWEAERRRQENVIERNGMVIQYVMAEPPEVAWAYTIGRLRQGRPELVILGVDPQSANALLQLADRHWHEHITGGDGPSSDDPLYRFLPIPDRVWDTTSYLMGARLDADRNGMSDRRQAFQLVWSDPDGRFPWEPDFEPRLRHLQPLLGMIVR